MGGLARAGYWARRGGRAAALERLQCAWRRRLAQLAVRRLRRLRQARLTLQSAARRMFALSVLRRLRLRHRMAALVQAYGRGRAARRLLHRHRLARTMQAWVRRRLACATRARMVAEEDAHLAHLDRQREAREAERAEADRRRRGELLVQQAQSDAIPLLQRDCSICMEPLSLEDDGPAWSLPCHSTHCFHAGCLERALQHDPQQRCPICRTPSAHALPPAGAADRWCQAARTEARRIAEDWEQTAEWDDMTPAQPVPLPDAHGPVTGHVAPGEWHAIDAFSAFDCAVSPCAHLLDVPSELRVDWARAHTEVFDQIAAARAAGDALALERGLKWHLCLHDVLLRGPRRGTRGSSQMTGMLEARFTAWRAGDRCRLLEWWRADRARAWARAARLDRQASRQARDEESMRQAVAEVLSLMRDGEMSRAMRLLHSLGVAGLSESVLRQLAAKHPEREHVVPDALPAMQVAPITVSLTETFRGLRRRAGANPSGHRNEFLRTLVGQFGDATADRVMQEYDTFATAVANVELPLWFYSAEAIGRLVPLVKSVVADHVDARPIAIGHTEARALGSHLVAGVEDVAGDVLAPQQLAVGVHSGISVLVHGVRVLLAQHRRFVVVRIDLRNAYNAISRAAIIRRMAARPEFAHLVPYLHAMTGPGSMLLLGRMHQRLFPFADRPDSSEGLPQGFNLASLGFCVGMQPELEALDALLSAFGGCARAIMDDVYAVGPASVVFPAVQRFVQTLRLLTGLDSHVGKYACFSHEYDLAACPWRAVLGVPIVGVIMVGGVPIGDEMGVLLTLREKGQEVATYIDETARRLRDHPHALWAALHTCCQSRFDYWLRHCEPWQTEEAAGLVDAAITRAVEQMTYVGCLGDEYTSRRFCLPARYRGCGFRRRADLARVAYVAGFIESAEVFLDRRDVSGALVPGLFPSLHITFGAGAFDHGGPRFHHFTRAQSDLADEYCEAWQECQRLIHYGVGHTITGPLDVDVAEAGRGHGRRLQHSITDQIERVTRDELHRDMLSLARTDTRRIAWMSTDRLSSQWVTSHPTGAIEFSALEMPEIITQYLGRDSPVCRALAGRSIPCGWTCRRGGPGPRTCDPEGIQLGLATLPGDDDTRCHDMIGRVLFHITHAAGLRTELSPSHIFDSLVPVAALQAAAARDGRPPSIIPDGAVDVALPAVVTARGQRRGRERFFRRYLFDVKTIHAGTFHYHSAHAAEEQAGAVRHRETRVGPDYEAHARKLDRHFYGSTGTHPFLDRLRMYSTTRGAVFGAYGEASADVHDLISAAADSQAQRQWGIMGARTPSEMRAFLVARYRRQLGCTAVLAFARHRLARVPYIGVPRQSVMDRRQLLQRAAAALDSAAPREPHTLPQGFFAFQAQGPGAGQRGGG